MHERERAIWQSMDQLMTDIKSDFCALGLIEGNERLLVWKWVRGNISDRYMHMTSRPGKGLNGAVVKVGRGMSIHVAELIARRQLHEYPLLLAEKLRSAYAVPLMEGRQVIGVLLTGNRTKRIYGPTDRQAAEEAGARMMAFVTVRAD